MIDNPRTQEEIDEQLDYDWWQMGSMYDEEYGNEIIGADDVHE